MKELIIETLEETGVFVPEKYEDLSLEEYIEDSFQFITFISNLEERLDIEFPVELINFEVLSSFNGFCNSLEELIHKIS